MTLGASPRGCRKRAGIPALQRRERSLSAVLPAFGAFGKLRRDPSTCSGLPMHNGIPLTEPCKRFAKGGNPVAGCGSQFPLLRTSSMAWNVEAL